MTNQLFYRESYDFQEVLDKIGDIVAVETSLAKILDGTRTVLANALKPSFIEYVLVHDKKPLSFPNHHLTPHVESFREQLSLQRRELIEVEETDSQNSLHLLLVRAQVALSLRLKTQKEIVGHILIGHKKNGEPYSSQDRHLLTITAGELAVAIQNAQHFQEIQAFNTTLQQRVDEATRKIRATNEKLKKLDETKDEFISMASHQLRTPLTSVKGYLSMVLEGDAGPLKPQQEELLKQSFLSSQRMVNLIADLLNLSRLNTGKFVIEAQPTDLRVIVDQEVAQLHESAKAKNITVTWDMPSTFSLVELDEGKMHQVVMNLIDNAIYYTPMGGTILIELKETPSAVEFTVKDSGIGVPRAEQRHLFTKFYRAENAKRTRPDGTGLGLYMAKKVVVVQGGSILFESVEGKGSTFGFRFARSPVAKDNLK
ncbi:hypothetical protein IPL68_00625 [Candidatus Saccharibacteria bacterium]|nr:MAG: hypothetical protein IPL68_00625 [Candidatus Saccharibacteria bacterium]